MECFCTIPYIIKMMYQLQNDEIHPGLRNMFDNLNLITSKVLILLSKPKVLRLLGSKHSTKRIISGRSFQGGAANPRKITRLGYLSYLSNRPQIFLTGQELQTSANTSSSVARHTIVNPACKVQSTYMWA